MDHLSAERLFSSAQSEEERAKLFAATHSSQPGAGTNLSVLEKKKLIDAWENVGRLVEERQQLCTAMVNFFAFHLVKHDVALSHSYQLTERARTASQQPVRLKETTAMATSLKYRIHDCTAATVLRGVASLKAAFALKCAAQVNGGQILFGGVYSLSGVFSLACATAKKFLTPINPCSSCQTVCTGIRRQ